MSFFVNEFNDLRTNQEFNDFVNDTTTHQTTDEYNNMMAQQGLQKKNATRAHICKLISNQFNNQDQDNFDVNKTAITVFVGELDQVDINDLINILTNKGYTVTQTGNFVRIEA